ncbi:hypothetical protein [Pantoea sp. Tr-811]|uniref:hypothetical protein n=1 Tax=Pantoea sp. Tr-811 TaxID=2608361 RepID=UPI001423BA48|nr:hypothetical protein [Pantoea sp. Tr-811]
MPQGLWIPCGSGLARERAGPAICNPLYGKSAPWKKQRFIPRCTKPGISRDDAGSILAYPQSSHRLTNALKSITK